MDNSDKVDLMSILNDLGFAKEVCVLTIHNLESGVKGIGQSIMNALAMVEQLNKAAQVAPIAPDAATPTAEQPAVNEVK